MARLRWAGSQRAMAEHLASKTVSNSRRHTKKGRRRKFVEDVVELRRMPYADYLTSKWWKKRRKRSLLRARFRCEVCGKTRTKLATHHKTYIRLGCERDEDLIVLCEECHGWEHEADSMAAKHLSAIARSI